MKRAVLIADDHSVALEGLRHILVSLGGKIVGNAETGPALVQLALERQPEIVVLDLHLPGLDGIEALRQIRERQPSIKFLLFTKQAETAYVEHAFRAGAHGYVLRSDSIEGLQQAWTDILEGRFYLSPPLRPNAGGLFETSYGEAPGKRLTARQRNVLRLLAEGKTAREIGSLLGISIKTVEFHKQGLSKTLGLRTIAQLSRFADAHGLLDKD